jgi:orotate phosphoribosyltransferase
LFNDGASLSRLSDFYARRILAAGAPFDVLFGPAYKGIPLAAGNAMALAGLGRNTALRLQPQGSQGSRRRRHPGRCPAQGARADHRRRDSAGTSVRESVDLIRAAGATPAAC